MDNFELTAIILSGISTISIYTFLVKENPLYRFFEHLFIGVSVGYLAMISFEQFLWDGLFKPLFGLDIITFPDGTTNANYDSKKLLLLVPAFIGLLYYFVYSIKFNWLAQIVIGLLLGASAGQIFQQFINEAFPLITDSFRPLLVVNNGSLNIASSINNLIFMLSIIATFTYFFFTFKKIDTKGGNLVLSYARYIMMSCFGAYFGSTIVARMALLSERIQFLSTDWINAINQLF